jgi:Purine nucleoside permease
MFLKALWKWRTFPNISLGFCLALMFTAFFSLPTLQAQARALPTNPCPNPFAVKVLIITMFNVESDAWLSNENFDCSVPKPVGADRDVYCETTTSICLTIIGVDKVNATASMMALLRDTKEFTFDAQSSYFMTTGTASTSPSTGTLGFAAWARWVVDWDQGFHLLPATVPGVPFGYIPPRTSFPDETSVFQLNAGLAQLAAQITSHLSLQDSAAASADRRLYPGQAHQHPYVTLCDTITGDNIWAGKKLSLERQYITSSLTNGAGKNCTYEQEDSGVAAALKRVNADFLNHYLNLRVASAFDQPYPGQTVIDFVNAGFRVNDIAAANLYLVGSTMAHYLVDHNP